MKYWDGTWENSFILYLLEIHREVGRNSGLRFKVRVERVMEVRSWPGKLFCLFQKDIMVFFFTFCFSFSSNITIILPIYRTGIHVCVINLY